VVGEEGFVFEEQRRNECPPVVPPFQNQKWGEEGTRRLDLKVDASWTWAGGRALPGEEREGNFGHFFYTNEERMPPCGPPISKPEMGGGGDLPPCGSTISKPEMGGRGAMVGEEGFVSEEQRRNECLPVVPQFQNQKWGDKVTRAGG